jgi:hypothetical protein
MNELQKKSDASLPVAQTSNYVDPDFESSDFNYGWLRIAAPNSEAVQPGDKQIKGLAAGQFFNTMTQKIYGESVKVIPLKFFHSYSEYTKGQNPEFIRAITPEEWKSMNPARSSEQSGFDLPNGTIGKEQLNYMVTLPDDPEAGVLRFALSAGSFASAKSWNYLLTTKKVPKHEQVWNLKAVFNPAPDKNKSAFYAIGRGAAFGGSFVRLVDDADKQPIADLVEVLRASESRLHEAAPVEPRDNRGSFNQPAQEPIF